jgi:tetratricopeptide (TPR) repeat protein
MMHWIVWMVVGAGAALAQHQHHPAAGKPAKLLDGMGTHSHPIATKSKEAQRFFDQGLALLYGFNHDEAARLFARAAELDPASPMPHWGIAYALGPNYNLPAMPEREALAWQAIEKGTTLMAQAPARERAYLEALVQRYSKDPAADRKVLAERYAAAMKTVMERYPDDLDAATLYAEAKMNLRPWQLWSRDGNPAEGTLEICAVLEGVLRRDPQHPGANHYYIHAVEASPNPERALPSAARLETLVPGAGHLVHMPSHIYARLGEFERSAMVNEKASEADRVYLARSKAQGMYPLGYYSHNLHFVAYSRMMQGRYRDAREWAQRLRKNVAGAIDGMPMIAAYGAYEWLVLVRFGQWEEMLREKAPAEQDLLLRASYHYARSAALAGLGRTETAAAERARMETLARQIPADAAAMLNPARQILELASVDLAARMARSRKDAAEEIRQWRQAVELEDALAYMEPPDWYYPTREQLGGALLRVGQAGEAEGVFRKDLEKNPRNGRSLHGLREALRAQGKTESLALVEREFRTAWEHADTELP